MNKQEISGKMKYSIELMKAKYICNKCGKYELISRGREYVICRWCGNKITKNDKNVYEDKKLRFIKAEYYRFINKRKKVK